MRAVAVVVVLAACGSSGAPVQPTGVFADASAPGAAVRACAGQVAWRETGREVCRIDRELAGYGCVRALADRAQVGVYVWKGCSALAAPVGATIARTEPATVVTLPEALRDPVSAAAIATVLVGKDAVASEREATGALAWVLAATHPQVSPDLDGIFAVAPAWTRGVPRPPALAAALLDPKVARADATRTWSSALAIDRAASLVVVGDGAPLQPVGQGCADYALVGNEHALAAVRAADRAWTYVAIDGALAPAGATCGDGIVSVPRGERGIASRLVISPARGVFADVESAVFAKLWGQELAELLVAPRADLPECATPVGDVPCVAHGDGWTLRSRGATRVLGWLVERADHDPVAMLTTGPLATLATDDLAIARRLGRVVRASDDPLVGWLVAGGPSARFAGAGAPGLRWQPGDAPVAGGVRVAIAPFDPLARGEDPVIVWANPPPATKAATCGALEVWTSDRAGAIVDRAKHRWAWVWIDRTGDDPLGGGRCFGDGLAVFDRGHAGPVSFVVDTRTGRWTTVDAQAFAGPRAADELRAALRDAH